MSKTFISLHVGIALFLSACATASPDVRLLGMTGAHHRVAEPGQQVVRVFVEVVNPGDVELELSRLDYRLTDGLPQLEASAGGPLVESVDSHGSVALRRSVGAHASTVIEVPVTLSEGSARGVLGQPVQGSAVAYTLDGRLYASAAAGERSWQVRTSARLDRGGRARQPRTARALVRVADRQ